MDLFILRHGEAGKRLSIATKDSERPLTVSGRREVEKIANGLSHLEFKFDRIITSPLRRSHETASAVGKVLKIESVEDWDELKPESSTSKFYARLSKLKLSSTALVVGHEPYLSSMIGEIISGNGNCRITLKKAGLAKVVVTSFVPMIQGELRWLLTPRQIMRIA